MDQPVDQEPTSGLPRARINSEFVPEEAEQ